MASSQWKDFDAVFYFDLAYSYDAASIEQITQCRAKLERQLFVDRLMKLLNISRPTKLYPPKTNNEFRNLFHEITSSAAPDHYKQSLIYYLLKSCNYEVADNFATRVFLPEKYKLFIEGIWHLDRMEFRRAMEYLTEPSLIPTFPDEILYTLIKHDKSKPSLAMSYYLTVSPPLEDQRTLIAYFNLLASQSVVDAFYFSRQRDEASHQELFQNLIHAIHSLSRDQGKSEKALALLTLPMSDEEEEWFEEYLLTGKGRTLKGAKDSVMMRRMATGKSLGGSLELESLSGRKIEGINWQDLRQTLGGNAGAARPSY